MSDPSMTGEMVGTVVGFMHPTAEWCHRDYSAISPHCHIGGPAPVALIRQSEAASLITKQADRIVVLEAALTRIAAIKYGKPDTLYAQKTVIDYARDQARNALVTS